jgi:hypothetical protein
MISSVDTSALGRQHASPRRPREGEQRHGRTSPLLPPSPGLADVAAQRTALSGVVPPPKHHRWREPTTTSNSRPRRDMAAKTGIAQRCRELRTDLLHRLHEAGGGRRHRRLHHRPISIWLAQLPRSTAALTPHWPDAAGAQTVSASHLPRCRSHHRSGRRPAHDVRTAVGPDCRKLGNRTGGEPVPQLGLVHSASVAQYRH